MHINLLRHKEIRLVFSVFLLIAALVITSKIYSLYQIHEMRKISNYLFKSALNVTSATLWVQSDVYRMHRDMKDVVLSESEKELQLSINKVNQHEQHVFQYLKIVRQNVNDAEGKKLEASAERLFREWKAIRNEVIVLVKNGQRAKAITITKGKGADQVQKLENATLKLYLYAKRNADYYENHSEEIHNEYLFNNLLIGLGLLILLFLISYYSLQRLSRHISKNLHLSDVLSIIRDVNQLIVREKNKEQLVKQICTIMQSNRVYTNVSICLYNEIKGTECIVNSNEHIDQEGKYALELTYADKIYGNLTVAIDPDYINNQEELSLLQEVVGDISYALYNIEREHQLREHEASLTQIKELYENIIDSIDNILFVKDTNFIYTVCNQAFEKFVGKSNQEIIGKSDYDIFEKEVADFFRKHDIRMFEEKISHSNFEWVTYPDGKEVYLLTVKSPIHNTSGTLIGLVGNSVDVTETKKIQDALYESEERFKLTMQQSPAAIELYDLEGTQIEVNRAYEELWGFPAEHSLFTFNLFKSEEVKKTGLIDYVKQAYQGKTVEIPPYEYDARGETEGKGLGRKRWLKTRIYPLMDSAGNIKNIVITHENVTEEIISKNALRQSQANYLLLANNAIDMIWKMDMNLSFTYVNPSVKTLLGYEIDEFIGSNLSNHFPPEEFKKAEVIISEILRTNSEKAASLEIYMYKKDGTTVPLEVNGKLIFDETHTPIGFQGSARDFTLQTEARKKLKEALGQLEKKTIELQTILQEAPNPIMLHNESGKVVMVNRVWESLSGYTLEEIDTVEQWAKMACSKNKPLMDKYKDTIYSLEHKIDMGETTVTTKDGNTLIWQFSSAPLGMIDGKQTVVTSAMDITELKKKDELMIAQSRHAAMGEMIGMIAHQWRQPIAGIAMDANNMLLDIAFETFDATSAEGYAQDILDQTQHLSKTIDDFRNFFKPDKSVIAVHLEEIMNETLGIVKESIANNGISVRTHYASQTLIDAYPRELMQVFINIINNAKDSLLSSHTEEGVIEIEIYDEEDYVCAQICDNGGGISETILPKIFDPYFSTKDEKTGTGLGLYMSKMIIEEHLHGHIEASNKKDGGACFRVKLLKKGNISQ